MIEVYKIMTGKESIDGQQFFEKVSNVHNLRGHTMKLYKGRSRLDIRKHFVSNRVANDWNSLPQLVIDAESVNAFKNRIDKYWKDASNYSFGFSTRKSEVLQVASNTLAPFRTVSLQASKQAYSIKRHEETEK